MSSFLQISNLAKAFQTTAVLNGVDIDVQKGSLTAIVGPSGCGKTTLLRLIAGFEIPDVGSIYLDQQCLAEGTSIVPAHLRKIGYVPQDGALFPHLSVADNIGFGLPRSFSGRADRIAELMDIVSLDSKLLLQRPHELSGGQQQRVALARALAQHPPLMLLDEPFSALDAGLRVATRKALAKIMQRVGITTILVTHDQEEALSFADQVAVMRRGCLVQVGTPRELYARPADAETAQFLGDAVVLNADVSDNIASCVLGHLPLRSSHPDGRAQIMLRPEQLRIAAVSSEDVGNEVDVCQGEIVEVVFTGAISEVSVKLCPSLTYRRAAHGRFLEDLHIAVHMPAGQVPHVGTQVAVTVVGFAHVLGAEETSDSNLEVPHDGSLEGGSNAESARPGGPPLRPPVWRSDELLGSHPFVSIDHNDQRYRLQLTQTGKLILTK